MDFTLTEEHMMLQRLAQDFAEKEVKPVALEYDSKVDPAESMPWDLIRKMDKLGLRTMNIPAKFGGTGIEDYLSACLVVEEVAVADIGVASAILQLRNVAHYLTCKQLTTEEQLQRFLPAFVKDEVYLVAGAVTEPNAGSDNILPYNEPDGGLQLSAVLEGDHYILNGTKHFISKGGFSKLYFVFARTNPNVGLVDGTSLFAVPHDTPGFHIGVIHDKMGDRLSPNGELIFDNARVPKENLLGPLNQGRRIVTEVIGALDVVVDGARCVGLARACYQTALEHARTRVQGGKPIIQHDLIAVKLVDMYTSIEAARSLIWRAAWAADHRDQEPEYRKLGRAASLNAHEVVKKVAVDALEIFGGYGIIRGHPVEKLVRDALTTLHFQGGMNVKRLQLKRMLTTPTPAPAIPL